MNRLLSFCLLFLCLQMSTSAQNHIIEKYVDSILVNTQDLSDSLKIASYLSHVTKYRFHPKSKPLMSRAMELAKQSSNNYEKAIVEYQYGNFLLYNGDADSALYYLSRAAAIEVGEDYPLFSPSIYISIGGVYSKKGDISNSIEQILIGQRMYDKIDTSNFTAPQKFKYSGQQSVVYNTLANSYLKIEKYDEALKNYDAAYDILMSMDAKKDAGVTLSNKGDLLIKLNRFEEAVEILQKGKDLKIEGKAQAKSIAYSDLNIGMALAGMDKKEQSLEQFNLALKTFNEENFDVGKMYILIERGLLFNSSNQQKKALEDCSLGKKLAIKYSDIEYETKACNCLYKTYQALGQHELALENFTLYAALKDSVFNENNIKKLTQLEMQYAFDKEQELQAIEIAATKNQNKIIIRSLLALLLLAAIIGFLLFRGYTNKQKVAKTLSQKNDIISNALSEKEVLLKEIHHRVKNNLQVISSLLSLQSRHIDDANALEALKEGRNRVQSMALIHQNLYQEDNLVGVNTKDYIEKLAATLLKSYKIDHEKIQLKTDVEAVQLDIDLLIPIGLILNELISNALKYAFDKDEVGEINVSFKKETKNILLEVSDTGKGFPDDFDINKTTTLGFRLIKSFSEKLKATLTMNNQNGTSTQLSIPLQ